MHLIIIPHQLIGHPTEAYLHLFTLKTTATCQKISVTLISHNFLCRGIAAGISAELSGEDIARVCIDCKADIIMAQNEQVLKKVIYAPSYCIHCN